MATHMVAAAKKTFRELQGVVVSAGLMSKTVKVRVGGLKWNARVQKVCSFLPDDILTQRKQLFKQALLLSNTMC